MARTHARVYSAIWNDPDFVALSANAQRTYILALSQSTVSFCGVVPYTAKRWAAFAADTRPATIARGTQELEDSGFVVVDPRTEEFWIRSFVQHDGILESPNLTIAMWKDVPAIFSPLIREGFLWSLPPEAWEHLPEGFGEGFTKPDADPLAKDWPTPTPSPTPSPTPRPRDRGQPIPDAFTVTEEMHLWAKTHCPDIDVSLHTQRFVNYFKAAPGKAGLKKDWLRTWQNWLLKEQDSVPGWKRNPVQR